jgi:hypothetical protein
MYRSAIAMISNCKRSLSGYLQLALDSHTYPLPISASVASVAEGSGTLSALLDSNSKNALMMRWNN